MNRKLTLFLLTILAVPLMAALAGCDETLLPPVGDAVVADSELDSMVDSGDGASADADAGGPSEPLNIAVKPYDPNAQRTPAQTAALMAKLVAGEDIIDVALLPAVATTTAQVAEAVVLSSTGLTVPLAGNEALLALTPGKVLVGGVPNGDKRRAKGGNNAFGFMRKVKSVKQVGDAVVVETENAALTDVFAGTLQVSVSWETMRQAESVDTEGVDLREYFPDISDEYVPGSGSGPGLQLYGQPFARTYAAWGVDFDYSMELAFKQKLQVPISYSDGIPYKGKQVPFTIKGDLGVEPDFLFAPGFQFGFDVGWGGLNYFRAIATGKFRAAISATLDATVSVGADAGPEVQDNVKAFYEQLKKSQWPEERADAMSWEKTLGKWGPKTLFSIAGVPMMALIELKVTCGLGMSGELSAEAKLGMETSVKVGIEFIDGDLQFPANFDFKTWKDFKLTGAGVSANVTCTLGPRMSLLIGGIGGPYVDGMGGAQVSLAYKSACPYPSSLPASTAPPASLRASLDIGLVLALGGQISVLGLLNYDFGNQSLYENWWTLWDKVLDVGPGFGTCDSLCEDGGKTLGNGETGVDCGGTVCKPRCSEGGGCKHKIDCAGDLFCWKDDPAQAYGSCSTFDPSDPCNNGKLEAEESDVDCGIVCGKGSCTAGKKCNNGDDCASALCKSKSVADGNRCVSHDCTNGFWDEGGETDVDCGDQCGAKCADWKRCKVGSDCKSGACAAFDQGNYCMPAACVSYTDGKKSGMETDTDCGGVCYSVLGLKSCSEIGPAKKCILTPKLMPKLTHKGQGGDQMFRCQKAQACAEGSDCAGGNCQAATKTCGANLCSDGLHSVAGQETDVDCGGPCGTKCGLLKGCKINADCQDDGKTVWCSTWNGKEHGGPAVCRKFYDNGDLDYWLESDIDCGGPTSPVKCQLSKFCWENSDCSAGLSCQKTSFGAKRCLLPANCADGKVSGDEADVDCGKACGAPAALGCKAGKSCRTNLDCESQVCAGAKLNGWGDGTAGTCLGTCGNKLHDPKAGEGDVDCGGSACADKCAVKQMCKSGTQCKSGLCSSATWTCAEPVCNDGVVGGSETDVDCGGGCVFKCGTNQGCKVNGDCHSKLCAAGKCQPPACENGKLDSGETDVDCGGGCSAGCANGAKCAQNGDCVSGQCLLPEAVCGFDLCRDGKLSGAESDVDCGGGCKKKCGLAKACATGKDCAAGFCNGKVCVASACEDEAWTAGETDVDCGGTCAPNAKCALGKACKAAGDCQSGFCDGAFCVASACADKQLSAGETDVDCGGACASQAKCALAHGCGQAADCQSGVCNGAVCVSGSCFDLQKTDDETDVDCGGKCALKCSTGKVCAGDGDCGSALCSAVSKTCVTSHCDDGKLSGDETALDCGGSCKTGCLTGANCSSDGDCFSKACAVVTKVCAASACFNQKLDANEMGLDCGGPCALGCAVGSACQADDDCASMACSVAGKCVGDACADGKLSGDETAVDCGGSCAATCALGQACKAGADCATGFCAEGDVCACQPGWGGENCDVKVDICKADKLDCDDDDVCTADSCDAKLGCQHDGQPAEGKPCDDANICTSETTCKAGKCVAGKTATCQDDGNACTTETCSPSEGFCRIGAKSCDDSDPCTADSCDSKAGCVHAKRPDGSACGSGVCKAGACVCRAGDYAQSGVCVSCACGAAGTVSPFAGTVAEAKLVGVGSPTGAGFGDAVGASAGRVIVANKQGYAHSSSKPSAWHNGAYLFDQLADGSWQQVAALKPPSPDPAAEYAPGRLVAVAGDHAAVVRGAVLKTSTSTRQVQSVWMYRRTDSGDWVEDGVLGRSTAYWFTTIDKSFPLNALDIALDGDTLAVAGRVDDGVGLVPFVDVYARTAGAWQLQASLAIGGAETSWSSGARPLALSGDRLMVGLPSVATTGLVGKGGALVFERKGAVWTLATQLAAAVPVLDESLGHAVALSGDRAVLAGAPGGRALVFDRRGDGAWVEVASLVPANAKFNASFPVAVAVAGDRVLLTSLAQQGSHRGAVHSFAQVAGVWKEAATWDGPDQDATFFGANLAVAGGVAVVGMAGGAPVATNVGTGAVAVYSAAFGCSTKGVCSCNLAYGGDKCAVPVDVCAAEKLSCDDGNACTKDSCEAKKGCIFANDDAASCDDGNGCTSNESCAAGACVAVAGPKSCTDDGDPCTVEYCDALSGGCKARALRCDDGKACTDDACTKGVGCAAPQSTFGDWCGGGAGKCQGKDCVCAPGAWLAGQACTECACDPIGAASSWSQAATVAEVTDAPLAVGGQAGRAVAISGATAVVGIPGKTVGARKGVVAVLERQKNGGWLTVAQVQPDDMPTLLGFGERLALAGGRFAVGDPTSKAAKAHGEVYVYGRSAAGDWQREARLFNHHPKGTAETDSLFGSSVAMSADDLVVGVPGDWHETKGYIKTAGGAHFFANIGGTWQPGTQVHCHSQYPQDMNCGVAVAIAGDWAAVSASNAQIPTWKLNPQVMTGAGFVSVFKRSAGGDWLSHATLNQVQPRTNCAFGRSLALDGDTMLVGSALSAAGNVPEVAVFRLVGDAWQLVATLQAPKPTVHGDFGKALALHGGDLLVGAPTLDGVGAAWLYNAAKLGGDTPVQLRPAIAGSSSQLGAALAVGEYGLIVGAPLQAKKNAAGASMAQSGTAFFLAQRSSCDGDGVCACRPGFGGAKCSDKVDICAADALNCDDGNACTTDSCDAKTGCAHAADDAAACDDGDACTAQAACKSGACVAPTPKTCAQSGDLCAVASCDATTGQCVSKAKVCDDGDPCTFDACNAVTGCVTQAWGDGTTCGGADSSVAGVCKQGACACPPGTMLDGGACVACTCNDWVLSPSQPPPMVAQIPPSWNLAKTKQMGHDVAASGDVAAALTASVRPDGTSTNTVVIFKRNSLGKWRFATEWVPGPEANGQTLFAVAVDGDRVVATLYENEALGKPGAVYVLEPGADGQWAPVATLYGANSGPGGSVYEAFGLRLGLSGDHLWVGASVASVFKDGRSFAYTYARKGGKWVATGSISGAGPHYAWTVTSSAFAISGTWGALAEPYAPRGGVSATGAVSLFEYDAVAGWVFRQELPPRGLDYNRSMGKYVALQGDTLLVSFAGGIELYRRSGKTWTYLASIDGQAIGQQSASPPFTSLNLGGDVATVSFSNGNPLGAVLRVGSDTLDYVAPTASNRVAVASDHTVVVGNALHTEKVPGGSTYFYVGRVEFYDAGPPCKSGQSGCFPNANCTSGQGGKVSCTCMSGYQGSGTDCSLAK